MKQKGKLKIDRKYEKWRERKEKTNDLEMIYKEDYR